MDTRVSELKKAIEEGTYDWDKAIETTAEKLVLLSELDMW